MTSGRASAAPRVSIVVLSWNTRDLLGACLSSLRAVADELPLQTIVVDNGSEDGSADMVASGFPEVRLVRNTSNEGYAQGNNTGAALARGEYLLLLNSDTEVRPGALSTLAEFLEQHPGHGACAPRLEFPDGSPQPSCKTFPTLMTAVFYDTFLQRWFPNNKTLSRYLMADFDHETSRDVDQPPGAALMIRRGLWEKLAGFDPDLWLFFNDVDLSRRLHEAGYRTAYVAEARVLHHEGRSTGQFPGFGVLWHRNRLGYYRKAFGWRGVAVARLMSTVRGWEEARRLRRAGAPREERAAVWNAVRQVWAA